ncbi:hypothetical protein MKEN_00938800 [Mycena kentingensis (nom. inval.)]|nr:hypothetical protein MKEN_00938800 [Mycena kentingensis (nom. inval.)]
MTTTTTTTTPRPVSDAELVFPEPTHLGGSPRSSGDSRGRNRSRTFSADSLRSLAKSARARTASIASAASLPYPYQALLVPHAPAIGIPQGPSKYGGYHMWDPQPIPRPIPRSLSRRRLRDTRWTPPSSSPAYKLELGTGDTNAVVRVYAYAFYLGFFLFPLWWLFAVLPLPSVEQTPALDTPNSRRTSRARSRNSRIWDFEKASAMGLVIVGPEALHQEAEWEARQARNDARTWRTRTRIAASLSLLTYVPFLVLIGVFLSRKRWAAASS